MIAATMGASGKVAGGDAESAATFDRQCTVMKLFSDNAKTYVQLSGAALGLTLTFARQILHVPENENIANGWMVGMWICFLVAILTGAFYQYLAVKLLEAAIDWQYVGYWNWLPPGVVYGVMLGAFYAGTIIFTVYAMTHL